MPMQRRWILGTVALLMIAASAALPALVGGQPAGLRFVVERQGPQGTVILLNNCDASAIPTGAPAGKFMPDNADCIINGEADRKQMEPIRIRGAAPDAAVVLKLVNYDTAAAEPATRKVRVFNAQGLAILGPRILGPDCDRDISDTYEVNANDVKQLGRRDLTLYAEGLQFAVSVRLQLWVGSQKTDEIVLHVAPFLLTPHTQDPLRNMVVRTNSNDSNRYVSDFQKACADARQLCLRAARLSVHVVSAGDPWMEDELQWGFTETPRCLLPVALHMHRNRLLANNVRNLLGPGVGYFQPFIYPGAENPLDYGGNLEVTPPTEKFPYGRVYYGGTPGVAMPDRPRQMDKGFQQFFKRQKRHPADKAALQEPISLWTSWLDVGHVDEIVTFVPANNPRGFVLLWASPNLAVDLLNNLPLNTRRQPDYLDAKERRYLRDYGIGNVDDLLSGKVSPARLGFLQMDLVTYNNRVAQSVQANVAVLQKGLGLNDDEIKPVPVLFGNSYRDPTTWSAVALTPGMVNLSSMGRVSLIPDPFIPVFKDHIIQTMQSIGQTPLFIDDWFTYHLQLGEVHCGSNMQREPFARKWWK